MSFLNLADLQLDSFTKVMISLWFRVPQTSVVACNAAFQGDGSPLDGVIPLMVMGEEGSTTSYNTTSESVVSGTDTATGPINGGSRTGPTSVVSDPDTDTYTQTITTIYTPSDVATGTDTSHSTVYSSSPGDPHPTSPTFIGIDCSETDGDGNVIPYLFINFETNQVPDVANNNFELTSISPSSFVGYSPSPPFSYGSSGEIVDVARYSTISGFLYQISYSNSVTNAAPAQAQTNGGIVSGNIEIDSFTDITSLAINKTGAIYSDTVQVAADVYHHVLVCLSLNSIATSGSLNGGGTAASNTSSYAQLFLAVDDVNQTEFNLSDNWLYGSGDPNAIITDEAYEIEGNPSQVLETFPDGSSFPQAGPPFTTTMPPPTYSLDDPKIPVRGNPMGIPASAAYVKNVYHVEMAEFFLWPDIVIDPASETNRRYFIDAKGKPVDPNRKSVYGQDYFGNTTLVTQGGCIEQFGRPAIMLHGSGNWISGKNTGTLGYFNNPDAPPGNPTQGQIGSGTFAPNGKIKKYKPTPSLKGDQGVPQ